MRVTAALVCLLGVASGKVFQANDGNFDKAVLNSGKNAFVKFLAPWCGHCKSMKPDWDKLGQALGDSEGVMIVDVDCTADGQGTCQRMGVQGYPTIKYFTDKTGKSGAAYNGGRDFASMKSFADSINKPACNAATGKNCQPNELKFIEENKEKSVDDLKAVLANKTATLKEVKDERRAAEKEMREKEKVWKKKEKLIGRASGILKQLIAEATKKSKK